MDKEIMLIALGFTWLALVSLNIGHFSPYLFISPISSSPEEKI